MHSLALPPGQKNLCICCSTSGAAAINTNTQSLGSAAAYFSFSSIASHHHQRRLSPLLQQVPLPLPLSATAACCLSHLLPPLTSTTSCRRCRLHLINVSASSSLPLPPRCCLPAALQLTIVAAIERHRSHQTPAIFFAHCRHQTKPPAISLPPPPPLIAIFAAVALPAPCQSPLLHPSAIECPLPVILPLSIADTIKCHCPSLPIHGRMMSTPAVTVILI